MPKKEKTKLKRKAVRQHQRGTNDEGTKYVGPRLKVMVAAPDKITDTDILDMFDLDVHGNMPSHNDYTAALLWYKREGRFLLEFARGLRSIPNMFGHMGTAHDQMREKVTMLLRSLMAQDARTIADMDAIGELKLSGSETFERVIKYLIARVETSGGDKK